MVGHPRLVGSRALAVHQFHALSYDVDQDGDEDDNRKDAASPKTGRLIPVERLGVLGQSSVTQEGI